MAASYSGNKQVVRMHNRELRTQLTRETLSGSVIPRVALPRYTDHGELLRFLREDLRGTSRSPRAFPFKREGEDPARMFAGEGDPFHADRHYKLLTTHAPATGLSTTFNSVALYGRDPHEHPTSTGRSARRGCRSRPSTT